MPIVKLRKVIEFEWDDANISHITKHNVVPEESEEVFLDKNNIQDEDLEHSSVEDRFLIIGKTTRNRLLYQIFTIRRNKVRVISSRDINKKEVQIYEKKVSGT